MFRCIVIVMVSLVCLSLSTVIAKDGTEDRPRITNPFLYSVEKGQTQSFLFGSIHEGVRLEQFPDYVLQAFDSVSYGVCEMKPLDRIDKFFLGVNTFRQWINLFGPALSKQLSPEAYKYLLKRAQRNGFYPHLVKWLTPSAALIVLDLDFSRKYNLDTEITKRLLERRVFVTGFDHPSWAMNLAGRLANVEHLEREIRQQQETSGDETLEDYLDGDADAILEKVERWGQHFPEQFQAVLIQRNKKWLRKMLRKLPRARHLFVGGAAHLFGKEGLISLLEGQGYEVRRINSPKLLHEILGPPTPPTPRYVSCPTILIRIPH